MTWQKKGQFSLKFPLGSRVKAAIAGGIDSPDQAVSAKYASPTRDSLGLGKVPSGPDKARARKKSRKSLMMDGLTKAFS